MKSLSKQELWQEAAGKADKVKRCLDASFEDAQLPGGMALIFQIQVVLGVVLHWFFPVPEDLGLLVKGELMWPLCPLCV